MSWYRTPQNSEAAWLDALLHKGLVYGFVIVIILLAIGKIIGS